MDEVIERLKIATQQPGKYRHPVSVSRSDLHSLIRAYEKQTRAILAKIWQKIQRIEDVDTEKEIDAPKPGDTKFFVVWVNERMDFGWYDKSQVHKFSDGALFIRDVWAWELESSGLTVVREDGVCGELLRPVRASRF